LVPAKQPRSCAGIRNLGDRAEVQLTEQLCDAAADSQTNLHGNVRLYDDVAEIGEAEEPALPAKPAVPVVVVVVVMCSTHGVEFRIDQFTHLTHDFSPQGLHVKNISLKASQCSLVFDTGGWLFYL
jgi:hypothetical protein